MRGQGIGPGVGARPNGRIGIERRSEYACLKEGERE